MAKNTNRKDRYTQLEVEQRWLAKMNERVPFIEHPERFIPTDSGALYEREQPSAYDVAALKKAGYRRDSRMWYPPSNIQATLQFDWPQQGLV